MRLNAHLNNPPHSDYNIMANPQKNTVNHLHRNGILALRHNPYRCFNKKGLKKYISAFTPVFKTSILDKETVYPRIIGKFIFNLMRSGVDIFNFWI